MQPWRLLTLPRRSPRGVSLLEALVVIAIVGIIAALGVPQMLPLVQRSRARGTAEELTALVEETRRRATSTGRCHRLILPTPSSVAIERRNSPDCVNLALDGWDRVRTVSLPNLTITPESVPALPANDRIIFRPNSRLRGDADLDTTEDGARLIALLPGGTARAVITVAPTGRICNVVSFNAPPALAAPVVCP